MAIQPWRKGKVIKIDDHTHNTRRFWIEVAELERFDFIPGQFVTLDLPIHEKVNKRWRSYSIASWPDGSNVFELLIVLAEGGLGTIEKDIFLICTGTGIAPFRSMVNYLHIHNIHFQKIYLIFGCRKQEDLLYFDELKALQERLPGFHYLPTLSREHWEGHHGYVHHIYEELCKDRQAAQFFLCGWKHMIEEDKKRIQEMGYDRKAIHQELYG